ncbi:MAG: hypothetical protein F6K14_22240 [Symploca sp. SIO2C1]|nr:hypothetical protein [Symploca sp. SIO2C1]
MKSCSAIADLVGWVKRSATQQASLTLGFACLSLPTHYRLKVQKRSTQPTFGVNFFEIL